MADEVEPMSDERLAEIREHCEEARYAAENGDDMEYDDPVILWQQFAADLTDILAEVERQRAREAALVAFAREVASYHEHKFRYEDRCKRCGIDRSEWSAATQRQARALLASE